MSNPLHSDFDDLLDSFERAWKTGDQPTLDDYLDAVLIGETPSVLPELVGIDLEYRLRAGQSVRVEDYLARFPRLESAGQAVLDLATLEYRVRKFCGEPVTVEEYQSRFSKYQEEISSKLAVQCAGTPSVSGFEILGVLGRGGMGVVYKARHLKLNRLVALKMILAGEHAGPQATERFLAEAKAAAKLSHPNMVQIYEVNEHNGLPYLAMEFVSGGTLTEHWKVPTGVREVAQLVATLADAISEAHRHGIIHRDLKPANILLMKNGQPKIGDFGLAKQLDEDPHTASGAVLGTPSYMAPEQAVGQSRDASPATDVYGLGAILYRGLLGRPPFVGENAIAILRQVTHEEPLSPSKLAPTLPRDLETICLKCLEKSPARRYESASSLADDLRRFLNGEPIQARTAGRGERLWKWMRRRPMRAALIGMTLLVCMLILAVVIIGRHSDQARIQAELQKRINDLTSEFSGALQADPAVWHEKHIQRLEDLDVELARLAPEQDAVPRQRQIDAALEKAIRATRKQELAWDQEPLPLPDMMRALKRRNPDVFLAVADGWESRLVLDLARPFASVAETFPLAKFTGDYSLISKIKSTNPVRASSVVCTGHVEAEAVFRHPTWKCDASFGIMIDANRKGVGQRGYLFLAEPIAFDREDENAAASDFAGALKPGGMVNLSIYRHNGVKKHCLLQRQTPAADLFTTHAGTDSESGTAPTVRLRVQRFGSRLTFSGGAVKLEFEDALPLTGKTDGVFGLFLPAELGVVSMRAWVKNAKVVANPLEIGDDLYEKERFPEAGTAYLEAMQSTSDVMVRTEAKYKQALCFLVQRDYAKASDLLTSLIQNPALDNERWRVLAMCQLWAIRLKQGKNKDAEALYRNLPKHGLERHLMFVPDYLCNDILLHYRSRFAGLGMLGMAHEATAGRELALELEQLFQSPRHLVLRARFGLFRAFLLEGNTKKAFEQADLLHRSAPMPEPQIRAWWFDFWEEYGLLLRQSKLTERALAELDKRLFAKKTATYDESLILLVERSCLHFHLGRKDLAEQDLNNFFRQARVAEIPSRFWTRACLMRGLLREDRDPAAAKEAWRLGLPKKNDRFAWMVDPANLMTIPHQVALAHLCEELTDREAEGIVEVALKKYVGAAELTGVLGILQNFVPDLRGEQLGPVFRRTFSSAEGKVLIRQVAFRESGYAELAPRAATLGVVNLAKKMLEPHVLSDGEETLLRTLCHDFHRDIVAGKIGREKLANAASIVLIWQDSPFARLSWKAPDTAFDRHLSGPLTYGFGLRYLHVFRKPAQAAMYFQQAHELSLPGSPLRELAATELKRLKKK